MADVLMRVWDEAASLLVSAAQSLSYFIYLFIYLFVEAP